jgi:hypothetical protein
VERADPREIGRHAISIHSLIFLFGEVGGAYRLYKAEKQFNFQLFKSVPCQSFLPSQRGRSGKISHTDMDDDGEADAVDCPLCCTAMDLTDRSIQYCGCGCESRRPHSVEHLHRCFRPSTPRLPVPLVPFGGGPHFLALHCIYTTAFNLLNFG